MNIDNFLIKISFIRGMKEIVEKEIKEKTSLSILEMKDDFCYLKYDINFDVLFGLRTINTASISMINERYNPAFFSKHKSILKNVLSVVLNKKIYKFKTFKISCAGVNSPEVRSMAKYITENFKLIEHEKADLKINLSKTDNLWELLVQATNRPLSVRDYKDNNMAGAMDPTIAYALNEYCNVNNKSLYLNPFSGSGTLLIEACYRNKNLKSLVGFDNNKKHLSLSYQNIKKSGFLKRIRLVEADVYSKPNLGKFDIIASDLPFGMIISKNENLARLYSAFIDYSYISLNSGGTLGVYTSKPELFISLLDETRWKIETEVSLSLVTKINSYLHTNIIICKKIKESLI